MRWRCDVSGASVVWGSIVLKHSAEGVHKLSTFGRLLSEVVEEGAHRKVQRMEKPKMKFKWTKRAGRNGYILEKVINGNYTPIGEAWKYDGMNIAQWYGAVYEGGRMTDFWKQPRIVRATKKEVKEWLIEQHLKALR